jgi:hypothetical protein
MIALGQLLGRLLTQAALLACTHFKCWMAAVLILKQAVIELRQEGHFRQDA